MPEFLTTSGTSHHIETIIIEARKSITLVSPYLKLSKTFLERLNDAARKEVEINILYGKAELLMSEKRALEKIPKLRLFFFQDLHAKCYFNESKMVITSMNMYEYSERKNREMGILIDVHRDKDLFDKAASEVDSILHYATRMNASGNEYVREGGYRIFSGFCIRCSSKIPKNPNAPYCLECYKSWSYWNNSDFPEKVCHSCGKPETTSMAKPECYQCYKGL